MVNEFPKEYMLKVYFTSTLDIYPKDFLVLQSFPLDILLFTHEHTTGQF